MEITLSAQGHLSRPSRHKILRSLRSLRMVGRIGILCAFKVLPTWRKWSGNSYEIIELLRKAEYYLWGKTNEKDVIEAADRISALVQGYDYNQFCSIYGWYVGSAGSLCRNGFQPQ